MVLIQRRSVAMAAVVAATVTSLAACGSKTTYAPVVAPSISATIAAASGGTAATPKSPITIAVIYTGSPSAEGGEFSVKAEGAVVAQYRLGGAVKLDAIDDHGTVAGASAAVAKAVKDGVGGIVYASAGPHIGTALSAASAAHIPTLVPYDSGSDNTPNLPGVWVTGPTLAQQVAAMSSTTMGLPTPIAVLGRAQVPASVASLGNAVHLANVDTGTIKTAVGAARSAIVWDTPTNAAQISLGLVKAVPGVLIAVPYGATGAQFGAPIEQHATSAGAMEGDLFSVGEDATEFSNSSGTNAFLLALRGAVQAGSTGLDGRSLADEGAGSGADTRAYDAVMALAATNGHLAGASLTTANGLAGGAMTFTPGKSGALADAAVAVLKGTSHASGRRPADTVNVSSLSWFAIPGVK